LDLHSEEAWREKVGKVNGHIADHRGTCVGEDTFIPVEMGTIQNLDRIAGGEGD
jgi:hypothetical protein